jgi:hypothetical protein
MTRINHRTDSGWIRRIRVPNGERYLVSPYMQSSNGAIEELNWVPALCRRRQQSTEQIHVRCVSRVVRYSGLNDP